MGGVTPTQSQMGHGPQGGPSPNRSRSGSFRGQSPTLMALGHEAFAGRQSGRASRACSWRNSPQVSRQGTETTIGDPISRQNTDTSHNSMPQLSLEASSRGGSSVPSARFQRPFSAPARTSSLGALFRSTTEWSHYSHGSK